jgi:DNA helicase-2/ATP-dependent DNA helicase PcrA
VTVQPSSLTRSAVGIGARELADRLGLPRPTDEQVAVVEAPLAPAVVIAGAGSGKTETMATRVLWLVANNLVPVDGVLGLTFTRKAATELGTRIRRQLRRWAAFVEPAVRAELLVAEPTVLTYAAYAGRLIADHALRVGQEPTTRLISPAVAWQLSDTAVRRFAGDLPDDIGTPASVTGYVLQLAADLADHLQTPDAVADFTARVMAHIESLPIGRGARSEYPGELKNFVAALDHRRQILPLVADYAARKDALGAVDFSDQMVWAARLATVAEVRTAERERFPAVLLDEYQDTGHAQIALLSGLFDDGHPVTAVGDPFQSIYSWRGASAGNIERFPFRFTTAGRPAATFPLSTSWRNDGQILAAANAVAEPLRTVHAHAIALSARPDASAGDVVVAFAETVEAEADWVAGQLGAAWARAALDQPGQPRTAAVLVRRRSQIPYLDDALRRVGLPVEIVGLGGLLTTAEVTDVVATLHVLADYSAGAALLRLLTGARWRIGPRDLLALSRRANALANPDRGSAADAPRAIGSIVEALDDLGDPRHYSEQGYRRMGQLAHELRGLRARLAAPLPELVADVERTIGVDIEVMARADRRGVGRVHLDRFLDAAAAFAAEADEATLGAFLAYLTAAEDEENGLEAGEVEVEAERIQILTVHGAKGLEWDVVAVPGLVEQVFPALPRTIDWTRSRQILPTPLRGDAEDLPALDVFGASTRRELAGWIKATAKDDPPNDHDSEIKQRHALDERRLAYVAMTRARHTLFASGYSWDDTIAPRSPSRFLTEIVPLARADGWHVPDPDAENPRLVDVAPVPWPYDPLGERRGAVADGAALVHAARAGSDVGAAAIAELAPAAVALVAEWQRDTATLLAERAAREPGRVRRVELPGRLSVSQLVALHEDPAGLARRLHRPMPSRPAPLARRGTSFHLWLEKRWGGESLLDLDQLPGAGDESAAEDGDLAALREAFLAGPWASRVPHEVEVPFEMVFDGVVVRGRMDAVFREGREDDLFGVTWRVVDWKTGAVPTGAHRQAVAVQLAAYRLAWQRITGAPLDNVRAEFYYVRSSTTVAPDDLLDADGLRALIVNGGTSVRERRS